MLEWLRSRLTGAGGPGRIKGYEIGEQIFSGAFSNIYKAYYGKPQNLVALKILTEAGCRIASLLDKNPATLWEGKLLANLDHPNIVRCVEYGDRPTYWLAMEFVESKLADYVGKCDNQEQEHELLSIFSQLISAITYLHEKGLIHRDISLNNILVDSSGLPKLIDFGLTVPADSSVTKGRAGTPSYMAPEMIRKWTHTELTDIYSFGVVMYEFIIGKKAFKGRMREQRMASSLNVHPPMPSRLGRYCSPELEELLDRCLSKDPETRPKSAQEIQDALLVIRHKRGLV
jgi:serine/threonine-protein kinase